MDKSEVEKRLFENSNLEPEFTIAGSLRTFTDWLKSIDIIRIIVLSVVTIVEELAICSANIITGADKLNLAVDVLLSRINAGGWFGLFVKLILKMLVSFAVSEMNTRYGKDWGTKQV